MKWNWQHSDWPKFRYNSAALAHLESQFLQGSGYLIASVKHLDEKDRDELIVEFISDEALKTSEIEGELLNRESLQSSVRKVFGLQVKNQNTIPPAERGISEMMVDVYRNYDQALGHKTLHHWHRHLLAGKKGLQDISCYRTTNEPMQIVSGALDKPKVHYVAPDSKAVPEEMDRFIQWIHESTTLPILTRVGIAHLYFLAIHPYIDGNGRIARALSEKLLAQAIGQPTLLALAQTIEANRKAYYTALQSTNRSLDIDAWLAYFANTVLDAQAASLRKVKFLIAKGKMLQRLHGQINPRQEKILKRLFNAGPDGFTGGLSAENYLSITKTSRATATRDLQDLVTKGALSKTGSLKHTRYWLNREARKGVVP